MNADLAAGADDYVRLRGQWNAQVRALAAATLHEWEVIEPELPGSAA
ncbi:hypothetical protein [Planosporangium mesophilum]|uniref:Uncharacterized protein n=1 Tax=Planosporangium mesophilum TaxID=689768 RepID=A0A8J3X3X4_9ACTN|nr:hypothetical protein [Planosporangium mesophilum]NJC86379.1 hypothetical protein [Planosporangium mesophilum]GII25984.1 hypothetical protein Pme01_55810 [Planosporangium mesophilum]